MKQIPKTTSIKTYPETGNKQASTLIINRDGNGVEIEYDRMPKEYIARTLGEYQYHLDISNDRLKTLNGEQILLIGGGLSPIRQDLKKEKIDATVTNIDHYFQASPDVADIHYPLDFIDFQPTAGQKYREIWSLLSMPFYSISEKDTRHYFLKSAYLLEPGGTLRTYPIMKRTKVRASRDDGSVYTYSFYDDAVWSATALKQAGMSFIDQDPSDDPLGLNCMKTSLANKHTYLFSKPDDKRAAAETDEKIMAALNTLLAERGA